MASRFPSMERTVVMLVRHWKAKARKTPLMQRRFTDQNRSTEECVFRCRSHAGADWRRDHRSCRFCDRAATRKRQCPRHQATPSNRARNNELAVETKEINRLDKLWTPRSVDPAIHSNPSKTRLRFNAASEPCY